MKNKWIVFFMVMATCSQQPGNNSLREHLAKGKWIDLSYDFSEKTIYWPNNPTGFKLDTQVNGITPAGFYYSSNAFSAPEHGGTHLDAPVHFAKGHQTTDLVPLTHLTGPAVVIDVSERALKNVDYLIAVQDLEAWEKTNGK